jgi:D-arabinose 1-dehydrogenase-like Zn-dependent alcohol dehydrogenase
LICWSFPAPALIVATNPNCQRRSLADSFIGGFPETLEMLDYCAEHHITSDVEIISILRKYTKAMKECRKEVLGIILLLIWLHGNFSLLVISYN